MTPLRILTVAGTRPEAIKLAPLVRLLVRRPDIEHVLVATGQHGPLFHQALDPFGVIADIDFALRNDGLDDFCAALAAELPALFQAFMPDLVLVQGDTSSAWTAALAAAAAGIAVGHVEAGLRSGDPMLPWPEERNRREIDALSTLLFAPSAAAAANLAGLPGRIHVTGNTGIDAMRWTLDRQPRRLRRAPSATDTRRILVTCHRREAVPHIPALMAALVRLAERRDVRIDLPVHPNPAVAAAIRNFAQSSPRIRLGEPLPYPELLARLAETDLLLTDSGGLQEEAPALGLPTLVLRTNSERPEPVASGNALLVGMDAERIHAEATRLLDDAAAYEAMAHASFPYGHGDAAERIIDAIVGWRAEMVELGAALP